MSPASTLRSPTSKDADAILDVCVSYDLDSIGEPNTTIEEIRTGLAAATMRHAVVDGAGGQLLGYVWVDYQPGHEKTWGDVTLRPGADPAHAATMLAWLIDTAHSLGPGLPIHTFCPSTNAMKRELLEAAGGEVVRRFFRMGITFDAAPLPLPALAAGMTIRPVEDTEADLRNLHLVADTSFRDHFGHEAESFESWRETMTGDCPDPGLRWLATVEGEPAAGLYGLELGTGTGCVDTLGTLREFRGRGLGRALLLTSFAEFYRRGWRRAVLGVDATNPTGALELYQSVGMAPEHSGLRFELR